VRARCWFRPMHKNFLTVELAITWGCGCSICDTWTCSRSVQPDPPGLNPTASASSPLAGAVLFLQDGFSLYLPGSFGFARTVSCPAGSALHSVRRYRATGSAKTVTTDLSTSYGVIHNPGF
jgi:hypothetical protein